MHGAAPPGSSALLAAFSSSNHWLTIDLPRVRLDKPRTNLLRATQTFKFNLYVYFCSPVFGAGRCPTEVSRRVEQKVAKGTKVVADLSSQRYAGRLRLPRACQGLRNNNAAGVRPGRRDRCAYSVLRLAV